MPDDCPDPDCEGQLIPMLELPGGRTERAEDVVFGESVRGVTAYGSCDTCEVTTDG